MGCGLPSRERCSYGLRWVSPGWGQRGQERRSGEPALSPDSMHRPVVPGHKGLETAQRPLARVQESPYSQPSQALTQELQVSPCGSAPSVEKEERGRT